MPHAAGTGSAATWRRGLRAGVEALASSALALSRMASTPGSGYMRCDLSKNLMAFSQLPVRRCLLPISRHFSASPVHLHGGSRSALELVLGRVLRLRRWKLLDYTRETQS